MTINPTNVRRFTPDVLEAAKIALTIDEGATKEERKLLELVALLVELVAVQDEMLKEKG